MYLKQNLNLASCTSFGSGGACDVFASVASADELIEVLKTQPKPFWLLGKGANSLISDKGLPGTTIHIELENITIEGNTIIAEAGVSWDALVQVSLDRKLWGLELTSGIPGTVGAAVVGNIAAYGQAVSDTLVWIDVISSENPEEGVTRMTKDELGLDYRTSLFSQGELPNLVILRAAFELSSNKMTDLEYRSAVKVADELGLDTNNLNERRLIIMEARKRAGSLLDIDNQLKTAGSFFKNPVVDESVAEMIMSYEERSISKDDIIKQNVIHGGATTRVSASHVMLAAGFERGQSWGPVRLHPDHILKIENTSDATSQQIYDVAQEIITTVREKLGIELSAEVRFLGDFS